MDSESNTMKQAILIIVALLLSRSCLGQKIQGITHRRAGSATIVIFLTSGTTWAVPANFNSANNTIECIGGGGGGQTGFSSSRAGGGGGGGAYSKAVNVTLTPSSTVGIAVGAAGAGNNPGGTGGDTFLCDATTNCVTIA